jgi:hypothetical protein
MTFLLQEVSKKSERITALEREKASLIRELFQTRSQNRRANDPQDDTAFMWGVIWELTAKQTNNDQIVALLNIAQLLIYVL